MDKSSRYTTLIIILALLGTIAIFFTLFQGSRIYP